MSQSIGGRLHDFQSFRIVLRDRAVTVDDTTEYLVALLKRRQITGSRQCAEATALLLSRMVEGVELVNVNDLLRSVRETGRRLLMAQPIEVAIGNVVRRVLALIREEAEENRDSNASIDTASLEKNQSLRWYTSGPPLTEMASRATANSSIDTPASCQIDVHNVQKISGPKQGVKPIVNSMSKPPCSSTFSLIASMTHSPAAPHPIPKGISTSRGTAAELRAEIVEGIEEILEELQQADEQIASYALEHVFVNDIVLTQGCSETTRKFLVKAASRRPFTVIHVDNDFKDCLDPFYVTKSYENEGSVRQGHKEAAFLKALTAAGISVISLPASAVFATMARVNKVILDTHVVLADGGLVAAAGVKNIAKSAYAHRVPVIFLSGVLQLSPVSSFDFCAHLQTADPAKVMLYQDRHFVDQVSITNPPFDYVPASLVELYITNLGGHALSYLYRIIEDHYRAEDLELSDSTL